MKGYNPNIKVQAKKMYVQEGKSANEISKNFNGKPTAQTVLNWVTKEKWDVLKSDYQNKQYEKLSPKSMAEKILSKIDKLLSVSTDEFTTKDADALAKLQKSLANITDSKQQLPIMFELLTDFVNFLENKHPELLTPDLVDAIGEFSTELKKRLER